MHCRAGGIVGIEHSLDRTIADEFAIDAGDDLVARHIRKRLVLELRRICAALTNEIAIQPLLGDTFKLTEEMKSRIIARVAPSLQHEMRCQFI